MEQAGLHLVRFLNDKISQEKFCNYVYITFETKLTFGKCFYKICFFYVTRAKISPTGFLSLSATAVFNFSSV